MFSGGIKRLQPTWTSRPEAIEGREKQKQLGEQWKQFWTKSIQDTPKLGKAVA